MSNLHGAPDLIKEIQSISGDLLPACLLTSVGVTAPGSGLTLTAASCTAYARSGTDLVYINQPAISVTVPNVAGSHWLIAHRDTHSNVAAWSRREGSHWLTQQAASQPTIPDGCVLVAQLTVAGGTITAVDTGPALSPPLSRQTADAVALTGGTATGMTDIHSGRLAIEWQGAPAQGLYINDAPAGSRAGILSLVSAGTGRYNLNCSGTAPNYLEGNLGMGTPPALERLAIGFAGGQAALVTRPSTAGLVYPLYFLNNSASNVGSISTSDTATAYNTSSDRRLKRSIQALRGGIEALQRLRPVSFRWNSTDEADIGFLAHELMLVAPNAVTGQPDDVHPDGSIKPQQVDQSKIIPLLTAALQELLAQVDALTARVTTLETALGL